MAKTKLVGKNGTFQIAAAEVKGCRTWAVNGTGDEIDTSALDDDGVATYEIGFTRWTMSATGVWDENEATAYGTAAGDLIAPGDTAVFKGELEASDQFATGTVKVTAFNISLDKDGVVGWTLEARGSGALTYPVASAA